MARKTEIVSADSHRNTVEIVVLIKAAPEIGQRHGETVCVAGVDAYGRWHRLYPVPFRDLLPEQRFKRWDRIRVRWRPPSDDGRPESKRIDPESLEIVSKVSGAERAEVAARSVVRSLEDEMETGRSLALIRPENTKFVIKRLTDSEYAKSARRRSELINQPDMFSPTQIAKDPPPFAFHYQFDHGGRTRIHVCIDWETEQTFFKWRDHYGEQQALAFMKTKWGDEIPTNGVVFAMGTHRVKMFRKWLLSGIIQAPHLKQQSLLL